MTSFNIFGPDPARGGTVSRPARAIIANNSDYWFNTCSGPSDPAATAIATDFLNELLANLRRVVRTAGTPDSESNDDLLAESVSRYASKGVWGVDVGAANALVVNPLPSAILSSTLFAGLMLNVVPANTNSGNTTLNYNTLGVKKVLRPDGSQIPAGGLVATKRASMYYDPTADSAAGAWILPTALLLAADVASAAGATQANMEAAASGFVVTPNVLHFHPAVAKAWVNFNTITTTAILASYGVSSLTDNGTGETTITFATAFSSVNYGWVGSARDSVNAVADGILSAKTAGTKSTTQLRVGVNNSDGSFQDSSDVTVVAFGDLP